VVAKKKGEKKGEGCSKGKSPLGRTREYKIEATAATKREKRKSETHNLTQIKKERGEKVQGSEIDLVNNAKEFFYKPVLKASVFKKRKKYKTKRGEAWGILRGAQ